MPDKKLCFVIGPIGATKSTERSTAMWLVNEVVRPVLEANFPDFEVEHAEMIDAPDQITKRTLDNLMHAELVIANLSGADENIFYELGLRHATGLPTIRVASTKNIPLLDLPAGRLIRFKPKGGVVQVRNLLKEEIDRVLTGDLLANMNRTSPQISKRARLELSTRITTIADAIAELRINSAANYVEQLYEISRELSRQISDQEVQSNTQRLVDKALKILGSLDQIIGSSRLGKLIISGALAGMVTGGGLPAAIVFGLSLAVWEGPDAFKNALKDYFSKRR